MQELFVNYEQALKLKSMGFDEPCIAFYYKQVLTFHTHGIDPHFIFKRNSELWDSPSAPLKSQVFKWFRDEHNIVHTVYSNASGYIWELHYNKERGGTHICDSE